MATKTAKKKIRIKWFSRILGILKSKEGLSLSQRKKNAEKAARQLLANHPKGPLWRIPNDGFQWEKLKAPDKRHRLTVFLEFKPKKDPGPGDAPVPAPTSPPIKM
jgi:hypothetical protein